MGVFSVCALFNITNFQITFRFDFKLGTCWSTCARVYLQQICNFRSFTSNRLYRTTTTTFSFLNVCTPPKFITLKIQSKFWNAISQKCNEAYAFYNLCKQNNKHSHIEHHWLSIEFYVCITGGKCNSLPNVLEIYCVYVKVLPMNRILLAMKNYSLYCYRYYTWIFHMV